GADQRHDDGDGARHQEEAAGELRIEPEALLDGDADRRRCGLARPHGRPGGNDTARVILDEARGIRLGSIGEHLDGGGTAAGEIGGEGRRDDDDAAHAAQHERLLELTSVMPGDDVEIARGTETRRQILRRWRRLLNDEADAGTRGIQRDAVAEEENEDERQHEGDEDAARIAHDLQRLLAYEGPEPP